MRHWLKIFSVVFSLLFFFSCGENKLIPAKKMQDILVDMSIAEAFFSNNNESDSVRIRTYSAICKKHKVSMAQWNNSVALYSGKYLSTYKIIYQNAMDSVSKMYDRLKRRQEVEDSIRDILYRIEIGDINNVNIIDKKSIDFNGELFQSYTKTLSVPYIDMYGLKMSCYASGIHSLDTVGKMSLKLFYTDSTDTILTKPILHNGLNDIKVNIAQGKSVNKISTSLKQFRKDNIINISDLQLIRMDSYNE